VAQVANTRLSNMKDEFIWGLHQKEPVEPQQEGSTKPQEEELAKPQQRTVLSTAKAIATICQTTHC
jgi:hypothetical protein